MVDVVVYRKRHLRVAAVHRTRRGIDPDALTPFLPAAFENTAETDEIAVDVGIGVGERIANTRLGRQIDHYVGPLVREELGHALAIGNVRLGELEVGNLPQQSQAIAFELDAVISVQVIDTEDFISAAEQPASQMRTDKTCCARH